MAASRIQMAPGNTTVGPGPNWFSRPGAANGHTFHNTSEIVWIRGNNQARESTAGTPHTLAQVPEATARGILRTSVQARPGPARVRASTQVEGGGLQSEAAAAARADRTARRP